MVGTSNLGTWNGHWYKSPFEHGVQKSHGSLWPHFPTNRDNFFFLAQEPLLEGIPPEAESQNPRLGFFLVIPMMSKWIGTGLYSIPNDASSVFIIYSQPPLWFSGGG